MSVLLPALLAATSTVVAPCTVGTWDLKASDQTIFRLEINTTAAGAEATWSRPEHFQTDGESFSGINGPIVRRLAKVSKVVEGDLELSFDDPRPGATPDIFQIRCVGSDRLNVTYKGVGLEPFDFVRAQGVQAPLGPWDVDRSYVRSIVRLTSVEMTAIFNADQADRRVANIDWSIVAQADEKRRLRTQDLLNVGALQSGEDFLHAAFVFQHGDAADDYLKAHLLAMIAIARGEPGALWIASATLDRYLHAMGKPQVLGTQYKIPKDAPATQEPYNRSFVSDAMRQALHVPSLAEQEAQRLQYTAKALEPKKP